MANVTFDINHPGISVYQALTSKELNEEQKTKILAEAIDSISKEFPNLRVCSNARGFNKYKIRVVKRDRRGKVILPFPHPSKSRD